MTAIQLLRAQVLGFRMISDWVMERVTGMDAEDRAMCNDPQFIADMAEAEADIAAGRVVEGEALRRLGLPS